MTNINDLPFVYDTGGREESGRWRSMNAGDCGVRAATIWLRAKGVSVAYADVYDRAVDAREADTERLAKASTPAQRRAAERRRAQGRTAQAGLAETALNDVLAEFGFPGLRSPKRSRLNLAEAHDAHGDIIAMLRGHYVAVVGGEVRDIFDSRWAGSGVARVVKVVDGTSPFAR